MGHVHPVRVYYEDTDMGGVVFYANYLKYLERGRSEAVASVGVDQLALRAAGIVFVVRRVVADYLAPARLGDDLRVVTQLTRVGGASLEMDQAVMRGETLLMKAEIRIAAMHLEGRPARLTGPLRDALGALLPKAE